jgi:hypothetical protein
MIVVRLDFHVGMSKMFLQLVGRLFYLSNFLQGCSINSFPSKVGWGSARTKSLVLGRD